MSTAPGCSESRSGIPKRWLQTSSLAPSLFMWAQGWLTASMKTAHPWFGQSLSSVLKRTSTLPSFICADISTQVLTGPITLTVPTPTGSRLSCISRAASTRNRAAGKRFDIISFYLDARGNLAAASPYTAWDLECSCKVSYSLDLWLVSVEGSVNARFDTTIG